MPVATTGAPPRSRPARGERDPEVEALFARWHGDGDADARTEIFERFWPLARRLATRYRNPYESIEDLAQVASLGLLGAIDRFDPARGARFEAFAIPTMLGELKRYFRDTGWSAHVPRRCKELALTVDRGAERLTVLTGRAPRVPELAEFLDLDVDDVLIGLDAGMAHYSASLDAPVTGGDADDPQALGDQIGTVDDGMDLVDAKLSLSVAISQLPHLERTALTLRIDRNLRQSEIAELLGCSQMQVSRLLRRAADRIRAVLDPELSLCFPKEIPS